MKTIESIDTPFDQTITLENQPSSNIEKLAGITVAVGVLNACAESSPPINKPVDDKILEECACMGGTPPPGAGPGAGVTPTPPATVALPAYVGSRRFRSVIGPSLTLATTMGMTTQTLSDGRNLPVWAFSDTALNSGFNGNRSIPGPTLEINQGQLANFTLSSAMPHTIHWHGLDVDQANDGVPSTSGFVAQAIPPMGNFGRLDPAWVLLGPQYTYSFTAPHAGTYMYHCHVDTVLHMEMGMSGTVIVRPADGNENVLWLAGPSFDVEYVWQLHTVDSRWHSSSPMAASGANTVRHRPNYFLINGKD
ncbi:MAG: multicopper oxidase domain-containing protein, partial [Nitrosomonas sp.]|nr:multicopper oxidase domain-containing protein [Nitrosomonas sp.]